MLRWRQVAMIVTLSLTLSATAHAECAWVLWWAKGSGEAGSHLDWEPQSAHLNKEACDRNMQAAAKLFEDEKNLVFRCLPDTVDPRGSKGK
jgi:hypothetical protein